MHEFFSASNYFFMVLTLAVFALASFVLKKTKLVILNPILISAAILMLILSVLNIPNAQYQAGCAMLSYLLTPATICLAIGFYQQFQALKKHLWAIFVGTAAGTVCSLGFVWAACKLCGLDQTVIMSLLPKSITTAIGTALAEELGGVAAITTFVIAITGIFGNIAGPALSKLLKIRGAIPQGVAFGTASHVMGTTRATELCALTGAVSSLSLTIAGLLTVVLLSFAAQF